MLSRFRSLFRRSRSLRFDIYAATWIDEIWVRSSVLAARRADCTVRLVISGNELDWPDELRALYETAGIELISAPTVASLHELEMCVVITASSGIPRSYFGESLQRLIHMPHSLSSLHTIYPADAFDGYDTLFASGPHHAREFAALGRARGLPERACHAAGYGKFDVMRTEQQTAMGATKHVLIAPSWGERNLFSLCGLALTERLLADVWRVTLRPHPSFFLSASGELDAILERFGTHERLTIERSTGTSPALWSADVMISDYSGMAMEFAALRHRPVLFVDGPRKILNEDWETLDVPAVEVSLRESIGIVAPVEVEAITVAIESLRTAPALDAAAIDAFLYDEGPVGERVLALLRSDVAEAQQ